MKRLLPLVLLVGALTAPGLASAASVVVKVDVPHHLVAVATGSRVRLAHSTAAAGLRVGEELRFSSTARGDGTITASGVRVVGHARRVAFRGFLLARDRDHLTVSAGGAVVRLGSPPSTTAAPGSAVSVTATVGNGALDADDVQVVSATSPGGRIEGTVAVIGSATITIASEHLALVLNVPAGSDLTGLAVGDEVLATFAQQPDGTLTLTALSLGDDEGDGDGGGHGDHHGGGDDGSGGSHGSG
jgi:hypothetical protein